MLTHTTQLPVLNRIALTVLTVLTLTPTATAHAHPNHSAAQPSPPVSQGVAASTAPVLTAPVSTAPVPTAPAPFTPPAPRVTADGWVLQTPALPHVSPWQAATPLDPQGPFPVAPLPVHVPGQPHESHSHGQPHSHRQAVDPSNGQAYLEPTRPTADPYSRQQSYIDPVLSPRPKRGKLHLDHAELKVVSRTEEWTDGQQEREHFRLTGSITNRSQHAVHKIRVHYRIRDGFYIRESGQFTLELSRLLQKSEYVDFNIPVTANGTLEIAFIDWKYEDGTQGVSQRGVF